MRIVQENRSDQELVAVCNRGERRTATAAFCGLYERHRDYVVRVALRFTQDRELAADVLQEVFTYLLKQFPPPGAGLELTARFTTYLYPITKNTTLTLLRKARRFESADVEPDDLAGAASTTATDDDLGRLFATLSAEHREILTLRFVDDLALDEIAAALQIPLGTVKSRLHHAIKSLAALPEAKKFFTV